MNFKLGFGPMSTEIVEILCNYSHNNKTRLMIIASRNQVDADSGYVMTTPQLREQLKSLPTDYMWICRDHCGPYFLDAEKQLSLKEAIEATKKTIAYDIEQGFDLIHIDTSRVADTYGVAEELIKFCLELNPNIKFEFGTEENIGVAAGAIKYKEDVEFAKQFPNMQFVVAQTGSLCHEDRQAGTFDYHTAQSLVNVAESAGVRLKEHNADYLTAEQIFLRKSAGVHALNIAPQLGVVQTKLLKRIADSCDLKEEWQAFAVQTLGSLRWQKWTTDSDANMRINVAGHYCFNSNEYKDLVLKINQRLDWKYNVKKEIESILDLYNENFLERVK